MESDFGLEIGDDEWWRKAEKRVLRDARKARRRARLKLVGRWLPLVLVVGVVGAGGVWVVRHDRLPSLPVAADTANDAAEAANPVLTDRELREPFLGTPAAPLLIEADGIVLPEARAIGRYSAADVAARLRTVRDLVVLSRFDSRMVLRRDPSALLARLSPAARNRIGGALRRPDDSAHLWVSRLAQGAVLLAPTRVHGTMNPRIGEDGELVVDTDYAFTYALKPGGPVLDRVETHLIVRAKVEYGFLADRRFSAQDQGIFIGAAEGYVFQMDCDQYWRGLLAAPSRDYAGSGEPMAEAERKQLYRADGPIPHGDGCEAGRPSPTPTGRPV